MNLSKAILARLDNIWIDIDGSVFVRWTKSDGEPHEAQIFITKTSFLRPKMYDSYVEIQQTETRLLYKNQLYKSKVEDTDSLLEFVMLYEHHATPQEWEEINVDL